MKRLTPAAIAWVAQPAVIALAVWLSLAGPERTYSVPVNVGPGALQYLAQAKATIDHGWWWTNPSLGAPSSLHAVVLLPRAATVDFLIIRSVGLFTSDVAGAVNVSWLLMLMLGGASAAWCLRRLSVSTTAAWVMGVLFAVCPFTIYYNIEQPGLTPYLVPFAAVAAIGLATGAWDDWSRPDRRLLVAGNVLVGLNGLDYAYFGGFFTAIGAIAGAVRARQPSYALRRAVVPMAIVIAAAANSLPSVVAAHREGYALDLRYQIGETEHSGLKVRQLVSPLPGHWLPFFRAWSAREGMSRFPYETENQYARLGIVAAVGFLGLVATILVPRMAGPPPHGETVRVSSRLVLAAVLLATVGGLGTLVSLWISPQVYVYARITPFIVFFALVALAVWLDRAAARRLTGRLLWAGILTLGLVDQLVAVVPLNNRVLQNRVEYRQLRGLVGALEERLSPGAMVFQLPVRPFPYDNLLNELGPYEHLKPYLVSRQLRWSYGALTPAQVRAEAARAEIDPAALPLRLAQEGFAAVLVDRRGYEDKGNAIIGALLAASGHALPLAQTDRYVAIDVRR